MKRSMMNGRRLAVVLVSGMLLVHCAVGDLLFGGNRRREREIKPPPGLVYSEVTFPVWPVFTELPMQAERRGNVMEIVKLGIALGDTGQHEKAAEVFLQGAKDFTSQGCRLEQAFICAAIMEHFKAGKISLVREDFKKLDALRTNPYSKYDDNEDIGKIRRLLKIK